jgi:uncharacterized protein (DUF1501 family)
MAVTEMAPPKSSSAAEAFAPEGPPGDVLVVLLLRGGWDGLCVAAPLGDPDFGRVRRRLIVPEPGARDGGVALDGFFGLPPELRPLEDFYRQELLAIVPACGSPDTTLSHFEAAKTLERGVDDVASQSSGWLSRYFLSLKSGTDSPLRAISLSRTTPEILAAAPGAMAVPSLADYRLRLPPYWPGFLSLLSHAYAAGDSPELIAGRDTLRLMSDLQRLRTSSSSRRPSALYPDTAFGRQLRELAQLIRAELGLEAAVVEFGGWDTHFGQAERMSALLKELGLALAAFAHDLGDSLERTVIIGLSEFGRRVHENSAGGTDHGRGTTLLALGGGLRGGRVYGRWPGLGREMLDDNGNLRVTTDYRHVVAEILQRRLNAPDLSEVFPGFEPDFLGLCRT